MGVRDRLSHAWNAFIENDRNRERQYNGYEGLAGGSWVVRPDRVRLNISNERSLVASIYTRLGVDASSVVMRHAKQDQNGRYMSTMDSGLNECLTIQANLDQGASAFRQDIFMTLFDKGVIAIVPVDVDVDPTKTGGYDIKTLRVGEIVDWLPQEVIVKVYNEKTGRKQELRLPKKVVAIVENPFYSVMNEPNSTLQRLIRKLNLLDSVDEAAGSGKLDLIVQLPYVIKSDARRQEAEKRRSDIELQLKGSKYGIAYTDGTEKITQLNRPAENNMLKQIEFLTNLLYSQLGLTASVFDGTADEATMLNYFNRTIEPVLRAVTEAINRTFLTKTARSQGQTITFSRDPFKLVPISQLADIADKFTRNEIASSNEIRAIVGWMPSDDPKADQLINSNMPQGLTSSGQEAEQVAVVDQVFSSLEADINKILEEAGG